MRSNAAMLALALVGCTASHSLGSDAAPAPTCSGHYASVIPDVDRACATDADCTIGAHRTTCCGDTWAMGIAQSARASFDALEAGCRAGLDACGCAAFMLRTDDGAEFMEGGAPIGAATVACVDGICTTRLRPSVPCGSTTTCRPSEACVTGCAGDGGMPAPHCVRIPSDCAASDDCNCFASWGIAPCSPGTCSAIREGTPSCSCGHSCDEVRAAVPRWSNAGSIVDTGIPCEGLTACAVPCPYRLHCVGGTLGLEATGVLCDAGPRTDVGTFDAGPRDASLDATLGE